MKKVCFKRRLRKICNGGDDSIGLSKPICATEAMRVVFWKFLKNDRMLDIIEYSLNFKGRFFADISSQYFLISQEIHTPFASILPHRRNVGKA